MKRTKCYFYPALLVLTFTTYNAHAAIDPAAEKVDLKLNCTVNSVPLDNCFTNTIDLTNWISSTRKPNITAPLLVNIGPGTFPGSMNITCDATNNHTGFTSFTGSGNGQTIIEATSYNSPVNVNNCTDLSFSHMTINGPLYGGITWSGGGKSKWVDIDVNGAARAWYEPTCGTEKGEHYWYSSKVTATAVFTLAQTYLATCDESWFFGSEVTVNVPAGQAAIGSAIMASADGIIHLYGSVLRALIDDYRFANDGLPPMAAARAGLVPYSNKPAGGEIHIHGTGIDVISNNGQDILALYADDNGQIHANASAYNMRSTGTITRIRNDGGSISAPYQWKESAEAPVITSVTGADTAVVTNTTDNHPHSVIYDTTCASKWFDTVTAACR